MKTKILYLGLITGLIATGCRKIEMDGQVVVVEVPGSGGSTAKRVELKNRITRDTTLRKGDENILTGIVYVTKGVTLTIEKGATIRGNSSGADVAALIISRGGKIVAKGTADEPIVFTSSSQSPRSGDWGGIVICGAASINTSYLGKQGLYQVEGGVDNAQGDALAGSGDEAFPTPNDNDSSGVLSFVRIEFAGYAFQPDKEINSLTMAAVGRKTVIDHIQVTYAKDDAFEWFGGIANAKYLIAWKTQDDDFDTDNGYSGKVQFGLVIRDSVLADISQSEAFESDNNSSGSTATPKTSPVFSNITAIGPRATLGNSGNSLYLAGGHIRRNTSISIFNSIIMGWPAGFYFDNNNGTPVDNNAKDSTLRIRNTTLAGNTVDLLYRGSASTTWDIAALRAWFTTTYFNNDILPNAADAKLIQPFNYGAPDPTPFAGSNGNQKILNDASFIDPKLTDPFFTSVNYRGAVAPAGAEATWWKGWTRFN